MDCIDREAAIKSAVGALRVVSHVTAVDIAQALEDLPTADVVPKSEVEKLNKELDNLAEELSDLIVEKDKLFDEVVRLRTILDEYEETSGLKQARADIAREIFEDIDGKISCFFPASSFVNAPHTTHYRLLDMLAELKKKYTEEKE